jgi:serine beta-lactamase-like protein LACTB
MNEIIWIPKILANGTETSDGYVLGWIFVNIKIDDDLGGVSLANHRGLSRIAQS